MKRRFYHRTEGQNVILIAGVLALLVGMAALAVDLGITYAEQRNVVRGVNAASLNGMNRLISGGRDGEVEDAIIASLRSNGVPVTPRNEAPQPGDYPFEAIYLSGDGVAIGRVGNYGDFPPAATKYIQVRVDGKVETFFARLFGQSQLPVGATAFASIGACATGYYPFGVHSRDERSPTMFDAEGTFANHDGFYIDQIYGKLRYRRLYLRDGTNQNGGFSLLRWRNDIPAGNAGALAEMLTGDGTYSQGYAEAPLPNGVEEPGYPPEPGAINANDWVYGNVFVDSNPFENNNVRNQLDTLKRNRTQMTLPIIAHDHNDTDGNRIHRILRFGAFLLIDYGTDNDRPWIDLAYVREGGRCASLVTGAPPTNNFTVRGRVTFIPRYRTYPDLSQPVQFLIILDVSGSMSWSFDGYGTVNGESVRCTGLGPGEEAPSECRLSLYSAWHNTNERRISIARNVLNQFVDQINNDRQQGYRPNDMVRIITFKGDLGLVSDEHSKDPEFEGIDHGESNAVDYLTTVLPETGWTNNVNVLREAIRDAGKVVRDVEFQNRADYDYLTNGATPSAVAFVRASRVFAEAPIFVSNTNNRLKYRRVVIFVTDGVANVLLNGLQNDFGVGCEGGAERIECQSALDKPESERRLPNGYLRPVDEMVYQADLLKQSFRNDDVSGVIYVVALSNTFQVTGLDRVASQRSYVKLATRQDQVDEIFHDIRVSAIRGECKPAQDEERDRMSRDELPEGMRNNMTGDDVFIEGQTLSIAGQVTLTDENNIRYTGWITASRYDRTLSYEIKNVPPGRYTLSAWLAYRSPKDGEARDTYELIVRGGLANSAIPVTVSTERSLGGVVSVPLKLDLNGNVCPAP